MAAIPIGHDVARLCAEIAAGVLPKASYGWTPLSVAERREAAGQLVIVRWRDVNTGRWYRITTGRSVLTAMPGEWDQSVRARRSVAV
jgi:hypothetical protein